MCVERTHPLLRQKVVEVPLDWTLARAIDDAAGVPRFASTLRPTRCAHSGSCRVTDPDAFTIHRQAHYVATMPARIIGK